MTPGGPGIWFNHRLAETEIGKFGGFEDRIDEHRR